MIIKQLKLNLMKEITPCFQSERDSYIPRLAAQDWERREVRAAKMEAAEARQRSLRAAQERGPRFALHRLPQNFWVAQITEPEAQLQFYAFAKNITGCKDLYPIGDHILFFRSNLPEQELRENIDLSFLPF